MPTLSKTKKSLAIPARSSLQLAQALRRFRRLQGRSQVAVGESAGLRQATVSKAEQGSSTTELGTIFSLCAALGLELVVRARPPT